MFKIAIANEKGGVAKTTCSTCLASALAEKGYNVLLFDLDAQANATLSLGVDPHSVSHSVFSALIKELPLDSIVLPTTETRISIVPSNNEVGLIEQNLPRFTDYESRLRYALLPFESKYDYAIFDCPPFLGSVTVNALTAANFLLVPTQTEYFSIYALNNLMELVRKVRAKHNPKLAYRLLITMFDRRNRIHRRLFEQLQNEFSMGLMETVIEIDTKLRECAFERKTLFQYAPSTRSANQFRQLVDEIQEFREEHNS